MESQRAEYVSAVKSERLLAGYDFFLRWFLRESLFKGRLVAQARIAPGHRVLDLGCGTGTLAILMYKLHPRAEVVGLDADPKILELARGKVARGRFPIHLDRGLSFELPYSDASFDRVLSSLVFHHLTRENKLRTLAEVFRVLRPGGELHIADYGKPQNPLMRAVFLLVQEFDGRETTADNLRGLLPDFLRQGGFEDVERTAQFMTLTGTLALYRGRKPKA